jgi:hypothetical protein
VSELQSQLQEAAAAANAAAAAEQAALAAQRAALSSAAAANEARLKRELQVSCALQVEAVMVHEERSAYGRLSSLCRSSLQVNVMSLFWRHQQQQPETMYCELQ